jgi:uncharacterized protein involved in type VI secretion and phage assembly
MNKIEGVVVGIVKSRDDPQNLGRILVTFPWLPGDNQSFYARIATLMSGSGRGTWFMPEIDDEVLVAFEHGDPNHPYVVGFLWNGQDKPPITDPKRRLIHSVNGHEIELHDPAVAQGDTGGIRIQDAQGNVVELSNASIRIQSVGTVQITAPNVIINNRVVAPTPRPI